MESIDRREALKRVAFLLGGTLSVPTVTSVLSGCQTRSPSADLQTLTAHQNDLVVTISEHIIPATDTPGAKAAGVNRFIDGLLTDSFLVEDRKRFLAGLDNIDARSEDMHGAPFLETSTEQQVALLEVLDEEAFGEKTPPSDAEPAPPSREGETEEEIDAESAPDGPPFFRTMKELTLVGYYTSEVGATEELRFDPVMGRYDACVPFEEIGRAWA